MISSHILTELAEMCTHIGIIERGHLLASGDVQAILRSLQPHRTLELRVFAAADRAAALLRDHPGVLDVRRDDLAAPAASDHPEDRLVEQPGAAIPVSTDGAPHSAQPTTLLVDYTGDERGMGDLLTLLVSHGVVVSRFVEQASDLEDIFMQVTKGIVQ